MKNISRIEVSEGCGAQRHLLKCVGDNPNRSIGKTPIEPRNITKKAETLEY
jgi:hypothetical protein